jgi:hypothetical protein
MQYNLAACTRFDPTLLCSLPGTTIFSATSFEIAIALDDFLVLSKTNLGF